MKPIKVLAVCEKIDFGRRTVSSYFGQSGVVQGQKHATFSCDDGEITIPITQEQIEELGPVMGGMFTLTIEVA